MITIFTNKSKSFLQENYNKSIEQLPFHQLSCTCGRRGELIKHGYYERSIKVDSSIHRLTILRVKCKACHITHALLPSVIVPYSMVLLYEHLAILKAFHNKHSFEPIMLANLLIDESDIRYIIKQYLQHWKERIAAFNGFLEDPNLVHQCFKYFSRPFMQIKCTPNILFC